MPLEGFGHGGELFLEFSYVAPRLILDSPADELVEKGVLGGAGEFVALGSGQLNQRRNGRNAKAR
jgi:hypothetical protein